ncbi:thrombospondin [Asanoa sp. NPDC049573]|uniref:thrombospondin n=1 Tax=Asanoa sp. NPDC049573 TaxID=3155396 RepID=UPI0034474363
MVKIPSFARRDESADADENRTASDPAVVTDRPAERPTLWGRWADRDRTRVTDPATGAPVATAPVRPTSPAGPNAPTAAERRLADTDLADARRADTDVTDARRADTRRADTRLADADLTEARRTDTDLTDARLADARRTDTDLTDARGAELRRTDDRPLDPDAETRPEPTPVVPAGPRPRTSALATLSLVFGISGAFLVLSGALAGYGIAAGAIGVLLAMFAFSATRKRHVAGKLDAMLGLLIGGAAVVIGILAFSGAFGWPTTDGDWVERLRGWLDSQFDGWF